MRKGMVAALLIVGCAMGPAVAMADDKKDERKDEKKAEISIRDDCDPTDPTWAPTGGCALQGGVVTRGEFNLFLFSPNAGRIPIGHPAWRMDPTYFRVESDETVSVKNAGGRGHTFTEVRNFGGGFVPPLNGAMTVAPECAAAAASAPLAPGERMDVPALAAGNHLFQCCIHPWMRILIKVGAEESSK